MNINFEALVIPMLVFAICYVLMARKIGSLLAAVIVAILFFVMFLIIAL